VWISLVLLILTSGLTLYFFKKTEAPGAFPGNILVLTLLQLNLILVVLVGLLLSRNLIKHFFERRQRKPGAGFRGKLIAAFLGFAAIPTILLLIVASAFLTNIIENWFSIQVEKPIDNALQTAQFYLNEQEEKARYYSRIIGRQLTSGELLAEKNDLELTEWLETKRAEYRLQGLEYYPASPDVQPLRFLDTDVPIQAFPPPSPDALLKAFGGEEVMEKPAAGIGGLIRAIVPVQSPSGTSSPPGISGILAVDLIIHEGLMEKMGEISTSYEEYRQLKAFKDPIKANYLLPFFILALLILFSATWFGFYLAKSITVPLQKLVEGTKEIARGNLDFKINVRARDEVGQVVQSFNRMTTDLRTSKTKLEEANRSLWSSNIEMDRRRAYIETVLENIATGVISLDSENRITTVNHSAERIFGIQGPDITGKLARDAFQALNLQPLLVLLEEMENREIDSLDRELQVSVGGKPLTLGMSLERMKNNQGQNVGLVIVVENLSELIKAQKAAAWQEAAKRIAHEIKNPLTPIQLSAQRLRKKYFEDAPDLKNILDEATATIINEFGGLKRLVDEFSSYARLPAPTPLLNNIQEIIEEVALLYRSAHKELKVAATYDPDLPLIRLDREQIRRVFVNLFENSVEALSSSGGIWITTRLDPGRQMAVITFSDEGVGFPEEDLDKMFQPYFSRKKTGTGLGLAIVHRIITDHDGKIRLTSRAPKGTTVIIELPVQEDPSGPIDPEVLKKRSNG
ncbi:MAG TPA: ATP-binding protein, partial [Nitrospiria bacterium]